MRYICPIVLFSFSFKSCFSSVGNRKVGKQRLSIGTNCDRIATIEHEFLHALGFWHEQSRADRDDYVEIMWDRISDGTDPLHCFSASWIIIHFFHSRAHISFITPCHDIHLHVRLESFSQNSHSNRSEKSLQFYAVFKRPVFQDLMESTSCSYWFIACVINMWVCC